MKKIEFNYFNSLPNAAKASVAFIIANVFIQGLHVITTPIFTRILSTADYGVISVFNSWAALAGTIFTLSLSSGAYNIGLANYENERYKFTSSLLILSTISVLAFSLLGLFFKNSIYQLTGLSSTLIILIIFKSILSQAQQFWLTMQRYEYKWKKPIAYTISIGLISSIVSVAALLIFKDKYSNNLVVIRIFSASLITIPPMIYLYVKIIKRGGKPSIIYWKPSLLLSLPLMVHLLAIRVLDSSDRIMINSFRGPSEAGMYSLVYTLASLSMIVWTAINGSLVPYTFEKLKDEETKKINDIAIPLLVIYGMISVALIVVAPEVIGIFAPIEYYTAVYIVPPVTISVYLTAVYNLFANIEMYYKRTNLIMINTIIASVTNIILNFVFIPSFGFIAAAYTTLITNILLVILHYLGMKKATDIKIYDLNIILVISFSILIIGIAMSLVYEFIILRIVILLILFLVLIIYRNRLAQIFNVLKKRG